VDGILKGAVIYENADPATEVSRTSSDETEAKQMTTRTSSHALSHLFLRFVTSLCLANFVLAGVSQRYSHAVANSPLGAIPTFASIFISLGAPLYVGLEIWWMRKTKEEHRALLVDGLFGGTCFFAFWVALIYAWGHYVSS